MRAHGARVFGAFGALACGFSVALGAYASHAADAHAGERLAVAAAFAFAHGLALLLLAGRQSGLGWTCNACFLLGTLLFSGSLVAAALFSASTAAAPLGGVLLMAGWLLSAVDHWRHPGGRHA